MSTQIAMLIRVARLDDLPAILVLIREVVPGMRAAGNLQWDQDYPNQAVFDHDLARGELWVAEIDARIAGVAAVTTEQEPEYAMVGWDLTEPAIAVHRLAVDTSLRGRGIAAALLLQAEVVARQFGITVVRLDTNLLNSAAQALFRKLGYSFAGEIAFAFRPGLRIVCFEKRLQSIPE